MSADLTIIVAGVLAASACAIIGTFLVLRQDAMLGDAISHAVLPGLALAFIITSSRDVVPMLIGAGLMGLLTAFLSEYFSVSGRLYKDAALGLVFTVLFAIGVILISVYAGQIDLDQECVLYGEIAYTPWDTAVIGGVNIGPRPLWILGGVLLADIIFIGLFYKQLKITSFDPLLADAVGIRSRLWHYLLMTMVSLTVVAAFETVGAILVVAMLIIPGATAFLITHRLWLMLLLSAAVGTASAVGGFFGAEYFDASIAGFMAVCGGLIFAATLGITMLGRITTRTSLPAVRS